MTTPADETVAVERERVMRPVIRLVAIYLGLSILIAVLVAVFHHSVLNHQFAHAPNHDSAPPPARIRSG